MIPEQSTSTSTVSVFMASLMSKRSVYNLARRTEDSSRSGYNPSTKTLEIKQSKDDYFFGFQYRMTKTLMMGVFYNYFMLNELAFTGTLFF
jgi:hypothetical protein